MFQASDLKGRNFMDLVNSDNNVLEPTCSKSSTWLQYFGHSNTLCARTTRVITNHVLIGEYQLVRRSLHLKMKVHGVGLDMHRV